jgi:type I restriction enzyme M protein
VCPQGVLFRGQPEKTEEEDGQKRKADDEYLIRRGFLQGKVDKNGEFTEMHNIIDAIVVLPGNLFYGTTIPGAILFINKNKPEERKDKVLMVYAAKQGWYKEEANMNTLLPHDMLRISTILESWGDITIAKTWIDSQKERLYNIIQDELDYKLSEIEEDTTESIELMKSRLEKAKKAIETKEIAKTKPSKSDLKALETAQNAHDKVVADKENRIKVVKEQADKERTAISEVEVELLTMLKDPELRKRYFAIADMEELEENEFNLNIPRYVDTFEPEEEIDLKKAIEEFNKITNSENQINNSLKNILLQLQ